MAGAGLQAADHAQFIFDTREDGSLLLVIDILFIKTRIKIFIINIMTEHYKGHWHCIAHSRNPNPPRWCCQNGELHITSRHT